MRKFVSVVAVLVMLFALAMPAFAADEGNSVVVGNDTSLKLPEAGKDGYVVDAWPVELRPTQKESVKDAAIKNAGKDATVGDTFEIEGYIVDANGDFVDIDSSRGGTITIVYDGEGVVAGVLYWSEERGDWDYAVATDNGDGTYSATLKHFCNAALVITPKPVTAAPAATQKPAASTGTKSPQTGVDATAYIMVTATLVLFAGFCFVKARKVSE